MLTRLTEQIEHVALRAAPAGTARVMGALPPGALAALQTARFRKTLRLAAERAPFYRDAFRRRGINVDRIGHPSELGDFFTTGEDLRTHGPQAFLAGRAETAFETTGTTSPAPKRVFFSNRELNAMGSASAAALHLMGLRREDIVLSAFDCSFWVSPAVARSALQYIGCFHVEAGKIDPLECYMHAIEYKPTVIFGEPSWMIRFAQIAAERGAWPVKLMVAGGENIAETARREVERVWGAPMLLNYGQTEAFGSLGLECREQQGYHRNDLHFLFEIDYPDRDGYGELVYTTLTRDVMPLIRYRASDITRLIDEPCACGLFARRLAKIRSRADEMVVCGMGNVGPWVFEEILRGIAQVHDEWQAVLTNNGRYDVIELRIEVGGQGSEVGAAVLTSVKERFPDFWKNLQMGLYELRVSPSAPGTLRTGRKLRRIVDERVLTPSS
ncbi:MAG TPA: AMP-binding protein [Vicinamibacterales bacterium]|nr:AMP-binding protein [Vicinamibacterales bacterium]